MARSCVLSRPAPRDVLHTMQLLPAVGERLALVIQDYIYMYTIYSISSVLPSANFKLGTMGAYLIFIFYEAIFVCVDSY